MSVTYKPLGKKQHEDNAHWVAVWESITRIVSRAHVDRLIDDTAREIERTLRGKSAGWGWSGGKDSQALRVVMEKIGLERCVLGMSLDLEYPEFLRWATDAMPPMLDVIDTGLDLAWLAEHTDMLFPQDSPTAAKWFSRIQHTAQREFVNRYGLDVLILGRRHADMNHTGRDGTGSYTDRYGITRYSPIRHWTHEEVLAVCRYYNVAWPPTYSWPNGFVVGSGCWPARQWTGSIMGGWAEVWQIDPSIVQRAAGYIPSAREFLGSMA